MKNWQIICSFTYPHEAHQARIYLENSAIHCTLQDEMTVQVYGLYSNALGGVKLLVPEKDFEQARNLLVEGGYIQPNFTAAQAQPVPHIVTTDNKHCPFCQSTNIAKRKDPNLLVVVLYFIMGVFFPIFKSGYQCFDCEKQWKPISPKQAEKNRQGE